MKFIKANKLIYSTQGGQNWFGVTHNMNIYRGCNHGCIYCDSRSSCYQIPNFDEIKAKEDANIKVDQELRTKRKKGVLGLGGMNDPYNYMEKQLEYTRSALKAIDKHGFGVHIITKSDLVLRDIEVLQSINTHSMVNIGITITTVDDELQQTIERNVSSSSARFRALKTLHDSGLYCGILMMPLLPFINDTLENVTNIVELAHKYNVSYIYPSFGVTLRDNQRQYFFKQIGPELTNRYVDAYGESYYCESPNADVLRKKFETLCDKYGIVYKMKDIVSQAMNHIKTTQISLF